MNIDMICLALLLHTASCSAPVCAAPLPPLLSVGSAAEQET